MQKLRFDAFSFPTSELMRATSLPKRRRRRRKSGRRKRESDSRTLKREMRLLSE